MYASLAEQALKGGWQIVQVSRDEIDENGEKRPDVCKPPGQICFMTSEEFLRELLLHRGGLFLLYQAYLQKPARRQTVSGR